MAALEDELLKQKYSANDGDAKQDARLLRSYLPQTLDPDIIDIIALFRPADKDLPNDREKQRWLSTLMGILAQAQKSRLPGRDIKAVYAFLGKEVYPFLKTLNNGGVGGLTALPADQAVLLVHSLKDELSVGEIKSLLGKLLLRFSKGGNAACKEAIDGLRSLTLRGPAILQIVDILKNIEKMEEILRPVKSKLTPHIGTFIDLASVCEYLKIAPLPSKEERYSKCLRKAREAVIPRDLNTNMVCVMYDAETNSYFTGFNATQRSYEQGPIPQAIWNNIPTTIDVDHYKFGRGCAEVHCANQAFAERQKQNNTKTDLKNCVFAAWHPKEQKERPACAGCNQWLTPTGAHFKNSA